MIAHADVTTCEHRQDFCHKGAVMLRCTTRHPRFTGYMFDSALRQINRFYETKAEAFQRRCETTLYPMAVQEYEDSVQHDFPFHPHEAILDYQLTYHQNCVLSLYSDSYEYTGGAHGRTTRTSETWSLQQRRRYDAAAFLPGYKPLQRALTTEILRQIQKQNVEGGEIDYFDDVEILVGQTLDTRQFYLTPVAVVFYFQQYDIAPYVSGFVSFAIPFDYGEATAPQCRMGYGQRL